MNRQLVFCVILTLWLSRVGDAAVILQYHHVADDTPASTSVSPQQFAAHMQALAEEGFRVVRLDALVDEVRHGLDPRDKVVAITFDDGFTDIAVNAMPVLAHHGWPATVFVSADAIDSGGDMLSRQGVKALAAKGHLIANHSKSHAHFLRRRDSEAESTWLARLRADIDAAQQTLADIVGVEPPRFFAYPYGEHDDRLRALLAEMGYVGFGQQSGAIDRHVDWQQVPRIPVNRHFADWSELRNKVLALPMPVTHIAPASGVTLETSPRLTFELPRQWQNIALNCFAGGEQMRAQVRVNQQVLTVTLQSQIPMARSRYTCTAAAGDGRYYWYSWLWMRRHAEGWYDE